MHADFTTKYEHMELLILHYLKATARKYPQKLPACLTLQICPWTTKRVETGSIFGSAVSSLQSYDFYLAMFPDIYRARCLQYKTLHQLQLQATSVLDVWERD